MPTTFIPGNTMRMAVTVYDTHDEVQIGVENPDVAMKLSTPAPGDWDTYPQAGLYAHLGAQAARDLIDAIYLKAEEPGPESPEMAARSNAFRNGYNQAMADARTHLGLTEPSSWTAGDLGLCGES